MGVNAVHDPSPIFLAPHVHSCWTKNQVVLLDLKRNKYFGLNAADADALARRVDGLPRDKHRGHVACGGGDAAVTDLLQEMLDAGMLVREVVRADARAPSADPPCVALIDGYCEIRARLSLRVIVYFLMATLVAKWLLRRRSLESIADRVHARRGKHAASTVLRTDLDCDRTQSLVAAFVKMRTFAFTANNECLFDSLALIEFLARYRIFPRWVFGVTTSPFAAHCWLQHAGVVINDSPEHVGRFTPILTL